MLRLVYFIPLILFGFLTACGSMVQEGAAPVSEARTQSQRGGTPLPPGESGKRYHAVSGLVQLADRYDQQGQYPRSAAFLERALRITPRDAWIWHKLALVRMKQGYYAQAEAMAKKSLSLPGNSLGLKISNWELVRDAAEKQGKLRTVQQAQQKLNYLKQQ